jgi:regulator of protease activity HflC (stomatin/prohibitin superfamily)
VKDLIFPGDLQAIMNRVLAAERNSEAQLVEARAKADVQRVEAQVKAELRHREAEAQAAAQRAAAEADAEVQRIRTRAEIESLKAREQAAAAYTTHPVLLRQLELETLRAMGDCEGARIYVDFGVGAGREASKKEERE